MLRTLLQRLITYPVLAPLAIGYKVTKRPRILEVFHSIRSLPHGAPLKNGLRIANYGGSRILFPSNEDPFFDDVFLRDVYHPYRPKREDVVMDIGAHMGFFTVKTARYVEKVLAFEPDPASFKFLIFNIKNNALSNVVALNCALGDEKGFMFLERDGAFGGSRLTFQNTGVEVKVEKLDDVVGELGISPTMLKIDTEGHEMEVLKGARRTLIKNRPTLVIAAYHYEDEAKKIARMLLEMGFIVSIYYCHLVLQRIKETYVYAVSSHA